MTKLDELKAKVEAATAGEWRAVHLGNDWIVRTVYQVPGGLRTTAYPTVCKAGLQPNDANADLIATAVNLARRLTSEEGVEAFARAYDTEDAAQIGEPSPWTPVWPASDPSERASQEAEYRAFREQRMACARAALNALLSDSQP